MDKLRNEEDRLSPRVVWGGGVALAALLAVLFWATWKSQFAAPPGYLFGTATQAVEAGYCLTVAQVIVPSGAPVGSYFDEAAQFWVARLKALTSDMGPAISAGRARFGRDKVAAGAKGDVWAQFAMGECSNRALIYGAHFRSFD
ncbi:hypothetical protein [Paenirhodobacter sp. CAU 1674]|jgi:hypothetical protein|uniref:hypothetical protein n=1 Tax=Paenirhodobacter sp. CAU 1674 TaxID=3032596 RepID=UPI0023DBAB0F|nr:hypothetical protein [Paenirhodobacter sp. CAU 1674]MDF2140101.1 hypothetical protein [Paenirhodobacter sp. CAU 1674]